ncbi:MAG: hypothetical protein HC808_02020 [Candidatus Competibacteraceae bacterium]|nr:hypothetical protein [Candidatus Competibacteraceae bacterium]
MGAWLPVPFFRVRDTRPDGTYSFDQGPLNWARVRIVELAEPDPQGNTHRVTLAFDTQPHRRCDQDGLISLPVRRICNPARNLA